VTRWRRMSRSMDEDNHTFSRHAWPGILMDLPTYQCLDVFITLPRHLIYLVAPCTDHVLIHSICLHSTLTLSRLDTLIDKFAKSKISNLTDLGCLSREFRSVWGVSRLISQLEFKSTINPLAYSKHCLVWEYSYHYMVSRNMLKDFYRIHPSVSPVFFWDFPRDV
jgi:hypothetical protein